MTTAQKNTRLLSTICNIVHASSYLLTSGFIALIKKKGATTEYSQHQKISLKRNMAKVVLNDHYIIIGNKITVTTVEEGKK